MHPVWSVSVVSHGHGKRLLSTLVSIGQCLDGPGRSGEILLTLNIPERTDFLDQLPLQTRRRINVIKNEAPCGFGTNHNRALKHANGKYFLIADPELSFTDKQLLAALERTLALPNAGVVSPMAFTPSGDYDNNGRALPTPKRLIKKYASLNRKNMRAEEQNSGVSWIAGLFMALPASVFRAVDGFDEGYFMYCEDVDLCLRVQQKGYWIRLLRDVRVTHHAARNTRKNLVHLYWHTSSLLRLWRSAPYRSFSRGPH